ncbi:MAG: HD domain-containing protein [Clostridiales bacterium]|jgi:HD-GYP domain-containing protein (c-di-GMP phosphodiesterase class II)|nr:HD domain-containing protein [Eubacteriales bacterium]MDH7565310.1 HD domain-containing protein [Clostridiales bacterium]
MRKVFVGIYEAVEGMQTAETIFNEYGAVIVSENTILDEYIIKKLKNLHISKIKVYSPEEDIIAANDSELFKVQYNENVEIIKDVLWDISSGKSVDIKKVEAVSESIFARINENRDIVNCLNQMRSIEEYTYTHSVNVSLLAMLIGKWMRYDSATIKQLVQAGLLHDVEKSKISPEILNKQSNLDKKEYEEIKKHPVYGYRLIENLADMDRETCLGVLMHHEREDGSGYPAGVKGTHIHPFAKIIAVADIYDAMTSNRAYREKSPPLMCLN